MKDRARHIAKLVFAAMGLSALLMTGCVPQERTSVRLDPDLSAQTGLDIDFVQVHNDVIDAFGDDNPYVFITNLYIDGTNDPKVLNVTATCLDEATVEDAEHFAAAVLRRASDAIAVQSNEYTGGDQQSFGNVYDSFAIKLSVSKDSAPEGEYLLYLDVPAGGEIELDPDIESYEESWFDQRSMILNNTVYRSGD